MFATIPCRHAMLLLLGSSALALALATAAVSPVCAASYAVGTQAELFSAIAQANADGDASSTITLTGDLALTSPGSIPTVSKTLVIDTGSFQFSAPSTMILDVAGGTELTIDGNVRITGTAGFQGALVTTGSGTLNLTGGTSNFNWYLSNSSGNVVIKDGANVTTNGNNSAGTPAISSGDGSLTVTGAGTILTSNTVLRLGSANGSTLNIEDGAKVVSSGKTSWTTNTGDTATLNVKDIGSLYQASVDSTRGTTTINVTGGGRIQSNSVGLGGVATATFIATPGVTGLGGLVTVSGAGSRWDSATSFFLSMGTLDVLDSGIVSSGFMSIGTLASQKGAATVSGAGSEMNTSAVRGIEIGFAGEGHLTVANGGKVSVTGGTGTIKLTDTAATGKATLNIGGGTGQAATASGSIEAALIQFGAGAGVLNFNHTDAAYAFDIALSGNGTINHLGSGKTRLTDDQLSFTGQTNVRAGILEVNGTLGGTMDVYGGRLQGTGSVGTTINHAGGTIAPGNSIGTLTILGDYTSDGGGLEIEGVLNGDDSAADLLVITGDSILGLAPTLVSVLNVGGVGSTTTDGIKIVEVQGARSDANTFVLNGPAIGGAYRYDLAQNDLATDSDGDWYLRNSGVLAPTTPTLENYPIALLGMIELPTLRQRTGQDDGNQHGIITRIEASGGHHTASESTTSSSYDSSLFLAQIGMSGTLLHTQAGSLTLGLTAQFSQHYASVYSAYGNGGNSTDSLGVGGALTWRGSEGTYIDLQAQMAHFSTDLTAAGYSLVRDNGGTGFAAGIEAGHSFALNDAWSVTPQGQLSYASVGFDAFSDRFGSEVSLRQGASLKGRIGVSFDYASEWQDAAGRKSAASLYGITNLTYEFLDGAAVVVSGTDLSFSGQKFGAELGVGGTLELADGAHAVHGEMLGSTSFQGSYAAKGTVGFTSKF